MKYLHLGCYQKAVIQLRSLPPLRNEQLTGAKNWNKESPEEFDSANYIMMAVETNSTLN